MAAVAGVYLLSPGVGPAIRPFALDVLALAAVYGLWTLLARPYEWGSPNRFAAATVLVDAGLITLWCTATGGIQSEYWTLYLVAIIAVAMRSSLVETLFASLGVGLLYATVLSINGGVTRSVLLSRLPLIGIAGFALGVLAQQRRTHQKQRDLLAEIAEERARALEDEQALVARLREVDIAKSEFVAVAAHEFRTPLATILGVIGIVRTHETLDPAMKDELLAGAQAQAQRLARLVEDLLTVSRIEDGALRLDVQPADPASLIAQAIQASRTGDRVRVELNGVESVPCDADQMVRVLTNLIDNARKYSPEEGLIFVTVAKGPSSVSFSVRDQGPGIPKERRDEVFDRYRRLTDTTGTPGAGLGLYITRCLVEAHGGTIRVDEATDGGADFIFTVPMTRAADSIEASAAITTA